MKRVSGAVRLELVLAMAAGLALLIFLLWSGMPPAKELPLAARPPIEPGAAAKPETETLPQRPVGSQWDGEITFFSDRAVAREGAPETTVWVYLPGEKHPAGSLPTIFIAADGTNGLIGAALDETNQPEHLPWVRAGFAVVAYSLAGATSENASDEQTMAAAKLFREAHGGVEDAEVAVAYALSRFPELDTKRFYLVGHGSAGTLALDVAGTDDRFAGCVAFGPIIKVGEYSSRGIMTVLEQLLPGTKAFAESISPGVVAENIKCPVLLMHTEDDAKVPTGNVEAFVGTLKKGNEKVTLVREPNGAENDAGLQKTIGVGVKWVQELGKEHKE